MFANFLSFLEGGTFDVTFRVYLYPPIDTLKSETPIPEGGNTPTYSIERLRGDAVREYRGRGWTYYRQMSSNGWKAFNLIFKDSELQEVPSFFRQSVILSVAATVNDQLFHVSYPFAADPLHRTEHGLSVN